MKKSLLWQTIEKFILMNYGKTNSNKLWKFHYDELYFKNHSNELQHIVLMRSWTCYSTWWACCSSLWHIINNKLFGKQNHVSIFLTWKIFVHLSALTLGCLSAFMKSSLAPQLWCDKNFQHFGLWVRQNLLNGKALMWEKSNGTIEEKR